MNTIKKHWFKVVVVVFLGYIFLQKDFSFQFNLNDKSKSNKQKSKDKYTENTVSDTDTEKMSIFDFFTQGGEKNPFQQFQDINEAEKVAFVKRFGKVAKEEQDKYGVPASLILANAMLQSEVGTNQLALEYNNFFAMQCAESNENCINIGNKNFTKYNSAWESFRAHSVFLAKNIALQNHDYKQWLGAMSEKLRIDNEYATSLRQIIEQYKLYKIDH